MEIIELKHHDSFNLPEPGFVKKCKENIEKYYQDYYDVLNSLTSLEQNAEGVLLLCGKDFLTEKLSELESEIREVTTVCDSIHRMKLYDMTVEKRNEILNDVKNKILAEKNNAISQKNNAQKNKFYDFLTQNRKLQGKIDRKTESLKADYWKDR